jgi:hypothetical protein
MLNKHDWSHAGYDAEELYFAKINRELIDRIKAEQEKGNREPMPEGHLAEVIPFPTNKANSDKKAA